MAIELTDDGTLDTVLRCSECGEEFRFNYQGTDGRPVDDLGRPPTEREQQADYDAWIAECIAEVASEHECLRCESCTEPIRMEDQYLSDGRTVCESCWRQENEPQDDDITTEDHRTFYQGGKRVLWAIDGDGRGNGWQYRGVDGMTYTIGTGRDCNAAIQHYMDRVQFWPNVWFISDHGNAHRIDLTEGK